MEQITVFRGFVGSSPQTKILEMLLTGRDEEYMLTDLVENTGVNRKTGFGIIKNMVKNEILVPTRKIRNYQFYKLNKEKAPIRMLIKLYDNLLEEQN